MQMPLFIKLGLVFIVLNVAFVATAVVHHLVNM